MSDEFGTVNVGRAERAREIEVMREQYRRHREALTSMLEDAPTEHLAQQYARLIGDLDGSLRKLDELDRGATGTAPVPPPPPARQEPMLTTGTEPDTRAAGPMEQPLWTPPASAEFPADDRKPGAPASRVVVILLVAFIGLALIGWLIWRASDRGDPASGTVVDAVTETNETSDPEVNEPGTRVTTGEPVAPASGLTAAPAAQDFGVVRKGTRAVRKFTLKNETDEPLSIKIARSTCRCLYYQHAPVIPPKNQETLTITIDGAKAKAGALRETLAITSADGSAKTSVDVIATVR